MKWKNVWKSNPMGTIFACLFMAFATQASSE